MPDIVAFFLQEYIRKNVNKAFPTGYDGKRQKGKI
jgi:hypothetical protein